VYLWTLSSLRCVDSFFINTHWMLTSDMRVHTLIVSIETIIIIFILVVIILGKYIIPWMIIKVFILPSWSLVLLILSLIISSEQFISRHVSFVVLCLIQESFIYFYCSIGVILAFILWCRHWLLNTTYCIHLV